jgi:hypothetical protein
MSGIPRSEHELPYPAYALVIAGLFCASAGCGGIPDVKVDVAQLATETTQLAVAVWRADKTPSKPVSVVKVPAEADRSAFSFGLAISNHDAGYIISVAQFSPGDAQKPCLRGTGTAFQAAGFPILSTLTVVMPKTPFTLVSSNCYDVLEGQTAPLITNAVLQADRAADMSDPKILLLIHGWSFQPNSVVKIEQIRNPAIGQPVITDRTPPSGASPPRLTIDSPTQLSALFQKSDLLWLADLDPESQIRITVMNPAENKSTSLTIASFSS